MRRTSSLYLLACLVVPASIWIGCSGSDGAVGATGATGATGPTGSAGPAGSSAAGNPSLSGVVPSSAFLGRTIDVVVSGNGTTFDAKTDKTAVKFGDDITVNTVTVASPTALLVNITIGNTKVGPIDVTVGTLTYKSAFSTRPATPLKIDGKSAQGSIAVINAQQLDFTTPFDTTAVSTGLFSVKYTNIKVSAVPGIDFQVNNVTSYGVDLVALMDVDTAAGPKDLDILSGPAGGTQIHNPIPAGMTVEARTAADLVADTAATGTVENAYDSYLYKYTPDASFKVTELEVTGSGTDAAPMIVLLPKSGKFADLTESLAASIIMKSTAADPFYGIIWDNTGANGYDFSFIARTTVPVKSTEASTDNDSFSTAEAQSAVPFIIEDASLGSGTDEDWYKFTAATGDVGKKVHVRTFGGDGMTDSVIDVFKADGKTSMGGPSDDMGYGENFTSTAITAAGDIFVQVSASAYFDSGHKKYDLYVVLK